MKWEKHMGGITDNRGFWIGLDYSSDCIEVQYGPDEYTVLPINVLESLLRTFGYVLTKTKNNTL